MTKNEIVNIPGLLCFGIAVFDRALTDDAETKSFANDQRGYPAGELIKVKMLGFGDFAATLKEK